MNIPAEEPLELHHPLDVLAEELEEPHQPEDVPAEEAEEPQEPNNPNPLPEQPPMPPALSGKPEEDVEARLLRTTDWMTTHDFPEDEKVRRFCLTLLREARLWNETLNAQQQQLNWAGLQEKFKQQYSKFGNTREQYFHAWRSFILMRQSTQ